MRNARICNPLYSFEAHPLSHHGTIYTMDYGIKLTLTVLGKKSQVDPDRDSPFSDVQRISVRGVLHSEPDLSFSTPSFGA